MNSDSGAPTPAEPADGPTCPRCHLAVEADAEFCRHCGSRLGPHKAVPWWHISRRVYDWTLAWAYRPSAAIALFVLAFAESSFFPVPPDVLLMPLTLGNRKRWLRYATICSVASVTGAVFGFCIGWLLWAQIGGFFQNHVPGFERDQIVLKDGNSVDGNIDLDCVDVQWKPIFTFEAKPKFPLKIDGGRQTITEAETKDVRVHVFTKVGGLYDKYNFWIVFTAGFTPIPFKVITITAGVFGTGPQVPSPGTFFVVFLVAAAVSRSARFFLVAGLMRLFGPKITPFIEKYFNWLALAFTVLLIGGFVVIKYVL